MNLNWENIRCFIEVAGHESLTVASKKLKISVPTLSRRIDALEQQMGLKLLHRSPTGTVLTEHGKTVLKVSKSGGLHLDQLTRIAFALNEGNSPSPIRISSTETVISEILAPQLSTLISSTSPVSVDMIVSNENVNLNKLDADIAIRLAMPASENLITRKLTEIKLNLYAAPNYLLNRSADDIKLAEEKIISYNNNFGNIPELNWINTHQLNTNIVAYSSSTLALLRATVAGTGVAVLPEFMAKKHNLILIPSISIPNRKLWLVFHKDMSNIADIKRVKQWIVNSFVNIL